MVKTIKDIFTEAASLNDYLSSRGINPKFVSRDTKISHAKSAQFQKWKSDRKMMEEIVNEASESELLAKFLNSRGINPKYATKDMKIAHSKSGEFQKWKRDHQHLELAEETDKKDMVCFDIPLLIRVLEYTREDMKTDIELHNMVERLINMRETYPLTMKDYDAITTNLVKENHIAIAMGNMLDDESGMVLNQLEQIERALVMIRSYIGKDYEKQLPAWVQAKITLATDYVDTVGNYINGKNEKVNEEVLAEARGITVAHNYTMHQKHAGKYRVHSPSGEHVGDVEKEGNMWRYHGSSNPNWPGTETHKDYQTDKVENKHEAGDIVAHLHHSGMKNEEVEQIDEITQADIDKSAEQEVAHAKKHGWKVEKQTYGRTYTHPKHGHIDMNRYGEWQHRPETGIYRGKGNLIAHGEFKDLDKHISSLKEDVQLDEAKKPRTTALEKWRKAASEREKKHNQTPTGDMKGAIDKLEKHLNKESVEQIDELKKSTMASYKDKSSASMKNAQANRDAAEPGKNMSKGFADLHAKSDAIVKKRVKGLIGYMQRKQGMKPTSENTLDSMAATEAPCDCSDNTNSTPITGKSYAAKMVKSLKKTVKEETYDWEKDDKSSQEKSYGKAPKMNVTDKTGTLGDTKPEARAVMKGGKTLTGQPRDMVEIDPSMKQRPGQQDKGQNTFTNPIAKKSPNFN